jgi:hypothetical protein
VEIDRALHGKLEQVGWKHPQIHDAQEEVERREFADFGLFGGRESWNAVGGRPIADKRLLRDDSSNGVASMNEEFSATHGEGFFANQDERQRHAGPVCRTGDREATTR